MFDWPFTTLGTPELIILAVLLLLALSPGKRRVRDCPPPVARPISDLPETNARGEREQQNRFTLLDAAMLFIVVISAAALLVVSAKRWLGW